MSWTPDPSIDNGRQWLITRRVAETRDVPQPRRIETLDPKEVL